jgi:hypothetical protein
VAQKMTRVSLPRDVQSFFDSPKNQRRLLVSSVVFFLIGTGAFVSLVLLRGTGNAFKSPISKTPAQLVKPDKIAPVSPAALAVARKFMETAVLRKHVDAAYSLVHVDLRGRMTRKEWDTGNIPVIGYPANNTKTAQFVIDYSYDTSMLAEVDLVAKVGVDIRPHLDWYIGLKRAHGDPHGRWLVSYWEPHWREGVTLLPP